MATHEMTMTQVDGVGRELWQCSECDRKIIITWPPNYSKNVVVQGDEFATHVGSKGGIKMGGVTVTASPQVSDSEWLRDIGIDWK